MRKGKPLTEEHKRKISEARKGKRHSEETRRKMSEGQRRSWKRIRIEKELNQPENHEKND